ncbi:MAG: hypothetical protein JF606_16975 [Burkholderiales bacterium]|jgi:hypothetical protein|nr:hypothetical protein [Burkholderiales bacterium]
MKPSNHSNLVIHDLERYVRPSPSSMRVLTPFGVVLTFVPGKFRLGQNVRAPGIDDCSARTHAEVMAVGTRIDFPGLWYLVRGLNSTTDFALIEEVALQLPKASRLHLVDDTWVTRPDNLSVVMH